MRILLGLNLVDGVQHHHALGDLRRVVLKLATVRVAAPDSKRRSRSSHHFISAMTLFNSAGMSAIAAREMPIDPSACFRATMLNVANAASLSG